MSVSPLEQWRRIAVSKRLQQITDRNKELSHKKIIQSKQQNFPRWDFRKKHFFRIAKLDLLESPKLEHIQFKRHQTDLCVSHCEWSELLLRWRKQHDAKYVLLHWASLIQCSKYVTLVWQGRVPWIIYSTSGSKTLWNAVCIWRKKKIPKNLASRTPTVLM